MSDSIDKYADIIDLPHPTSKKHPRMSVVDRAAQFASFQALTGHSEAIKETARLTDAEIELDGDMIADLNDKYQILKEGIGPGMEVSITHFVPDETKSGGEYITSVGSVTKIDEFARKIYMDNKQEILLNRIIEINIEKI